MIRFTLYGAYQFDPTLFDDVRWDDSKLDKMTLINEIMSMSGELFPSYQVIPMLKKNIGFWFNRNLIQFDRLLVAIESEYNPIENYDRYEDSIRTPDLKSERVNASESESSVDLKNTSSLDTSASNTIIGDTSAYNQNTYSNKDKTQSDSTNSNESESESETKSSAKTNATETVKDTGNERFTNHTHGNIGVMSSSELVEREFKLREAYGDIYRRIAMMFEKEFICQIY